MHSYWRYWRSVMTCCGACRCSDAGPHDLLRHWSIRLRRDYCPVWADAVRRISRWPCLCCRRSGRSRLLLAVCRGEAAFLCHSQYGSVDYRAAACNKLAVGDRWRHGLAGYSGTVLPACGAHTRFERPGRVQYAVATILVALLGAVWLLCRSRYGKVLAAISTNEWRALACGYHTSWHLLLMFVASAVLAAVAGCLMAAAAGVVAPDVFSPVLATEVILWVAIGGRGSLGGPMLAAVGLTLLKHGASSLSTQWWPLILGAVFLACVLCLPNGVRLGGMLKGLRQFTGISLKRMPRSCAQRVEGGS